MLSHPYLGDFWNDQIALAVQAFLGRPSDGPMLLLCSYVAGMGLPGIIVSSLTLQVPTSRQ